MNQKFDPPVATFIAGPNGAGKSTMAPAIMASDTRIVEFVNADLIARTISPIHPETAAFQAGKIMLRRLNALVENRENFLLETGEVVWIQPENIEIPEEELAKPMRLPAIY